jgi:hypothetical protein
LRPSSTYAGRRRGLGVVEHGEVAQELVRRGGHGHRRRRPVGDEDAAWKRAGIGLASLQGRGGGEEGVEEARVAALGR